MADLQYNDIAGALAGAAATISALVFAALQTMVTVAAGWAEELETCEDNLARHLGKVDQLLGGAAGMTSVDAYDQFETKLNAQMLLIIGRLDRTRLANFKIESAKSLKAAMKTLRDNVTEGDALFSVMNDVALNEDAMNKLEEMFQETGKLRKRMETVKLAKGLTGNIIVVSGLAVLAFIVSTLPPLQWGIDPFLIVFGTSCLFAVYLWLIMGTYIENVLSSISEPHRLSDWTIGGLAFIAIIALYVAFINRSIFTVVMVG